MTIAGRGRVRRRTLPPHAVRRSSAPYRDGGGSGGAATSGFTTGIRSPPFLHRLDRTVRSVRFGVSGRGERDPQRPPVRRCVDRRGVKPLVIYKGSSFPHEAPFHIFVGVVRTETERTSATFFHEPALQLPILRSAGLPQTLPSCALGAVAEGALLAASRHCGGGAPGPAAGAVDRRERAHGRAFFAPSMARSHRASSRGAPTVHELTISGVLAVRFLLHRRLYL